MSWPQVQLQEIVLQEKGALVSGPFGSSIGSRFFVDDGVPVIRGNNLTKGIEKFLDNGFVYLTESKAREFHRCIAHKDDIIFTAAGTIGQVGIIPENSRYDEYVISNKQLRARINKDIALPMFVYYWLSSKQMTRWLENMNNGGAVPLLNLGIVKRAPVPFPPLKIQDKIVRTLSAYDDLIENNKRRIELLEESARQLYKEWFVRFRFPGHEHVKIIDGVPEGWQQLKISDLCTVGRGASPRPIQKFMDGEIPWFKIADATASESPFIFETKEKVISSGAQKSVYLAEGELILSNSATCGVPNFTGVKGCIHDGWLYFKGLKTVDKWFLYLYLVFQQRALLQGIGEGATQKNLNTTYVGNQIVTIPDSGALLQSFTDYVEPLFMEIKTLASYNRQLSKARDLLLPKLMNGEIAV